jgi:hypothetical protein
MVDSWGLGSFRNTLQHTEHTHPDEGAGTVPRAGGSRGPKLVPQLDSDTGRGIILKVNLRVKCGLWI